MSRSLLDVNVLLALLDGGHADHERAHAWLDNEIESGWASCAITQNGFVRIISQPRYPSPVPPAAAIERLAEACSSPDHAFWPCEPSLVDPEAIDHTHVHGAKQVTDAYLLAMATRKEARFVTFDRSIPLSAVRGATSENLVTL